MWEVCIIKEKKVEVINACNFYIVKCCAGVETSNKAELCFFIDLGFNLKAEIV